MGDAPNLHRHNPNARHDEEPGKRKPALTKREVYNHALARLGHPVVEVDAEPQQFEPLWQATLDFYNRYMPVYKMSVLDSVSAAINKYNLIDLGKPFGREVVDVKIATRETFFSPISGVFALGIPHPISHLSPDQYDLALRYIKTARKTYSSSPDWTWHEPILWIYAPTGYGGPFVAPYVYLAESLEAEDIPNEDHHWIKNYFLALLKEAVGHARMKFGVVPGPNSAQMDGQALVQAAQSKMERLEEELINRSYAMTPPFWAGGMGA